MVKQNIIERTPLEVMCLFIDFIEICHSLDIVGNSEEGAEKLVGLQDVEDKMDVDEGKGANHFGIDIREVGCGFAFPKISITNLKMVGEY